MRHRATTKNEIKRSDHKRERAAVRQVLDGGHLREARSSSWNDPMDKVPILDDTPQGGHPHKDRAHHCKRNAGGPHVVESWPVVPSQTWRYDEEKGWVCEQVPWWRRPYHPPYRCINCHKGFYRIPRRGAVVKVPEPRLRPSSNQKNEVKDDHYDLYNIRARLLGLACRCKECNEVNS